MLYSMYCTTFVYPIFMRHVFLFYQFVSNYRYCAIYLVIMSLVDLGKKLLEAAKMGHDEEVRILMSNGAPFTTDWVSY